MTREWKDAFKYLGDRFPTPLVEFEEAAAAAGAREEAAAIRD
jgi:hypothetical protein